MEKYYKILGLKTTSTLKDLKNSRNELLKKYHPDYYLGNKKYAQEKTSKINEAYQKLKPIFEEKEENEKLEKAMKNLGTNQSIKPNKDVIKNIKNNFENKNNNKEKETKKVKETKNKKIDGTIIEDERKKQKDVGKRVLDVTIFVLGGIAILLIILFFTGAIK